LYKVLDLFSGIGGFSLGLERTGLYETVAFCEWDKSCQQVLNKNFQSIPVFGDIKNLTYDQLPASVDVIACGFPCQDISYAGLGAGIEGSRSGHWLHFKRLIDEIKPKGVLIENVAALRSRGLDKVLQDLNEVGYDAEWHCIPASYLGACHQRDRIWILAYPRSQGGERLEPLQYLGEIGQGGWGGKKDLQQVYDNPFGRSDMWPEPLLRRMDVSLPRRLDRLKQVGNSVYWPIVQQLGYHLDKVMRSI